MTVNSGVKLATRIYVLFIVFFLFGESFRCAKDNTLTYNYTLSSVQRFSLRSFKFPFDNSNEVFLHCQVKACLRSNLSSRCAEGCPFGKRRKRQSEYEVDQRLAIGPIIISNSQPVEKTGIGLL